MAIRHAQHPRCNVSIDFEHLGVCASVVQVRGYASLGSLQKAFAAAAVTGRTSEADKAAARADVGWVAQEARRCNDVDVLASCDEFLHTH